MAVTKLKWCCLGGRSGVAVTAMSGHWWGHIHGASALKGRRRWRGGGGRGALDGGDGAVVMKKGE